MRRFTRAATIAALLAAPAALAAQDLHCEPGDREIRAVTFSGNRHFSAASLGAAIVTTPSAFLRREWPHLPIGAKRCLDPQELRLDVARLRAFYRLRGYYATKVDTTVDRASPGTVRVGFQIAEGPATIIDTLQVTGLEHVKEGQQLASLLLDMKGGPYDRVRLASLEDTILLRLRDRGYAHAQRPLGEKRTHEDTRTATVIDSFPTGPLSHIDSVEIRIEPKDSNSSIAISEGTVRTLMNLRRGDIYNEDAILEAQRRLYQLEAYRLVEIGLDPESARNEKDSLLTVIAHLVEGDMHTIRPGIGYGSYDCLRAQARFTDRSFFGGARRLDVDTRVSKMGGGTLRQSVCRSLAEDTLSRKLNYYAGITFRPATFFGYLGIQPSFSIYSERRSEFKVYLRETNIGGLASATREIGARTPLTLSYQFESGSTQAEAGVFCLDFNLCDLQAIANAERVSSLNAVSAVLSHDATDNPIDPRHGSFTRLETRVVFTRTGTVNDYVRFSRFIGQGSWFASLGRYVLATRLQVGGIVTLGTLNGPSDFVPPQERLYAGGQGSVRGYDQNQLGPVVYVVDSFRIVRSPKGTSDSVYSLASDSIHVRRVSPTGGNALLVGSVELRAPSPFLPELLQLATFVDYGQLWNRRENVVNFNEVRFTPGIGLRARTLIGSVGVDVAYRPNSLEAGPAYYIPAKVSGQDQSLQCVSPGQPRDASAGSACPATFRPPLGSFWSRIALQISVGQTF